MFTTHKILLIDVYKGLYDIMVQFTFLPIGGLGLNVKNVISFFFLQNVQMVNVC